MGDRIATRLSRKIRHASHATSNALTVMAKTAPKRTPKLLWPNSHWPILLIQ